MQRIAHLSDLHLPCHHEPQVGALIQSVNEARPALIVITGDLTRAGRRHEYRAASAFLGELQAPIFAVPGNHDIPVFSLLARATRPLARFHRLPGANKRLVTVDRAVAVAGMNTARAISLSLDWSLGRVSTTELRRIARALLYAPPSALRIVACHHPLVPHRDDLYRSRTRGGVRAIGTLARLGVSIVLHGHLHRGDARVVPVRNHRVLTIGAGASLSDRKRGAGSAYNLIDLNDGHAEVVPVAYSDPDYVPGIGARFDLVGAGTNPRLGS